MAKLTIELNAAQTQIMSDDVKKSLSIIGEGSISQRKALEQIIAYQNAKQKEGDYNSALPWDELASALVGAYNANQRHVTYMRLLETENPMLSAIETLTYDIIRIAKSTSARVTTQSVVDAIVTIDIIDFRKFAKERGEYKDIGWEPRKWEPLLERLNLLYLIRAGRELGDPKFDADKLHLIKDSYVMTGIAKEMEVAESDISKPQLLSKTNLLRELNQIGQAMLGPEFKFRSYDVAALYGTYKGNLTVVKGKDGKYVKVSTPSTRTFAQKFIIAMNTVLNGGYYHVESGQLKRK